MPPLGPCHTTSRELPISWPACIPNCSRRSVCWIPSAHCRHLWRPNHRTNHHGKHSVQRRLHSHAGICPTPSPNGGADQIPRTLRGTRGPAMKLPIPAPRRITQPVVPAPGKLTLSGWRIHRQGPQDVSRADGSPGRHPLESGAVEANSNSVRIITSRTFPTLKQFASQNLWSWMPYQLRLENVRYETDTNRNLRIVLTPDKRAAAELPDHVRPVGQARRP